MDQINLENYGYTVEYKTRFEALCDAETELVPARVLEVQKEMYTIVSAFGENKARLKGSLFYHDKLDSVYPVVGDFVAIKPNPSGEDIIYQVLERKSKFSRLDSFNNKEQMVVSNFDYVFIMASLNKDFNLKRIERYLTITWQSGALPVILLTKADLCEEYSDQVSQIEQNAVGVPVIPVSSVTGEGLEQVAEFLKPQKTVVFLGSSGVGKSSLANAVAHQSVMKVNDIREDDSKGRHTTTFRHLMLLENGAMIIDTPGMRELGMWTVSEGLETVYSDIEALASRCRFADCTHDSEPGCAVKAAIASGELPVERFHHYLKLLREARFAESKENKKLRMQDTARNKSISKFQKQFNKKFR